MRTAFVLTTDLTSPRTLSSENVLKRVGFDVQLVQHIPNEDMVLSNKLSMQSIYQKIIDGDLDYGYVFENDINILDEIRLPEIIQYESISPMFFYMGVCCYNPNISIQDISVEGHPVTQVSGGIRGLHAIGLSKEGAAELLKFSMESTESYMDVILEEFSKKYPSNVVRYDLQSYIRGHRGVFFQDRRTFPSEI